MAPASPYNAFDSEGRAVQLKGVPVTFDALGRAVEAAESSGTVEFLYGPAGGRLAAMSGQTVDAARIALPGGGAAVYNASGLADYLHGDGLGSARLASTPSRSPYASTAYTPYGAAYDQPVGLPAVKSFTGQPQDVDSTFGGGQYDFPMREYNGIQGRWWTPDPAGVAAVNPANPQTWDAYAYVAGVPNELVDPTGLCGNVVIGGSTETPLTPDVEQETRFADSIGADIAFPFAGEGYRGSFASIEAAALGTGSAVDVAKAAILHTAANGGPFTIFAFSGGAQAAKTALAQLPDSISSRATVVGISPGFGFGPDSLFPSPALMVSGVGAKNIAVVGTAFLNGQNSGPDFSTTCGHAANCQFRQAGAALLNYASASCGQPATFSRGITGRAGGGGAGNGWDSWLDYIVDLFGDPALNEEVTHRINYGLAQKNLQKNDPFHTF